MRKVLLLWVIVPGVVLAAPTCMTQGERMGLAAVGFMASQALSAQKCDRLRGGPATMTAISKAIEARFAFNLIQARKTHDSYFRRVYGKEWRRALARTTRTVRMRFEARFRATRAVCANLRDELENRAGAGWDYIKAKLAHAVRKQGKLACG